MEEQNIQPRPVPWIRLLAFYFDITVISAPLKFLLYLYSPEYYVNFVTAAMGIAPSLMTAALVMPVLAFCTARFGTTPGKALLSAKVVCGNGRLGFTSAFKRAVLSYVAGTAMMLLDVMPFTLYFCWRGLRIHGTSFWDRVFHTYVVHEPLKSWRVALLAVLLAAAVAMDTYPMLMTVQRQALDEFINRMTAMFTVT